MDRGANILDCFSLSCSWLWVGALFSKWILHGLLVPVHCLDQACREDASQDVIEQWLWLANFFFFLFVVNLSKNTLIKLYSLEIVCIMPYNYILVLIVHKMGQMELRDAICDFIFRGILWWYAVELMLHI